MSISMTHDVLMVVPGESVDAGLSNSASRHNWPILQGLTIPLTLREVVTHNPRVVVVQLGHVLLEQTMNLIGAIRQLRPRTRVVVASTAHHELLEQASRCAGATAYLSDAADESLLEDTVASLAQSAARVEARDEREMAQAANARRSGGGNGRRLGTIASMFIAMLLSILAANSTQAAALVLQDQYNTASFNIPGPFSAPGNPVGLYDLTRSQFDASNPNAPPLHDMTQQWFWYRVGNTGPEHSIDSLTFVSALAIDKNLDGNKDRLILTYNATSALLGAGKSFQLKITYDLTGYGQYSHTTGLTRSISFLNTGTSSTPLDIHFWDYSDLTLTYADHLNSAPFNERTQFPDVGYFATEDGRTVRQYDNDNDFNDTNTTLPDGTPPFQYRATARLNSDAETISLKVPNVYGFGRDNSISAALSDGSKSTFVDNPNGGAPGNLEFYYEYDFSLAKSSSWLNTVDLLIVPEPASVLLLIIPSAVMVTGRRRRRRETEHLAPPPVPLLAPLTPTHCSFKGSHGYSRIT